MNAHGLAQGTGEFAEDSRAVVTEDAFHADQELAFSDSNPVCVTGMHRSGTSMVANLLNLCGLYLGDEGDLIGPSEHNTRGYWENRKFLGLNEEVLAQSGGGWDMPPPVRAAESLGDAYGLLKNRAAEITRELKPNDPWGWKDPRNCLTMPFWKTLFPRMNVVVCVRNPLEVVSSLKRRGSCSKALGFYLWLTYNQRLLAEIPPERRIITHYEAFFSNPQGELRRIADYLGISVSNESIEQACRAVATSCRNNRSTWSDLLLADAPSGVADLYGRLCADAGPVYARVAEEEGKAFTADRHGRIPLIEAELRERKARYNGGDTVPLEQVIADIEQQHVSTEALLRAGELCFHYGLYDRAKCLFDEALSSEPQNSEALNNLGVLYFQLADFRAAKGLFCRALEVEPDHAEAGLNLSHLPDIPEIEKAAPACATEGSLSSTRLDQLIRKYGTPFCVDLGCGAKPAPGHVGIDRLELDCVDIVCDVAKGIPLPDASVKEIRSIHFFEHISGSSLHKVVREVHRILVPGGSLYIRLPYYTHKTAFYASHLTYWNKEYFDSIFVKTHGFVDSRAQYMYSEEIRDKNNPFHQIFATHPEWCRIHLWNVVKEIEYWCRKPGELSDE